MAHAETSEAALENLAEAGGLVLRHLRQHGLEQPGPGSAKLAQAILAGAGVA